ncbi:hypothetical protein [Pseudorhodoferax sp.]|uniref:hypothetical protein n=1 Tax=Pseudorhodoferax sp. TaxID=1993553 RepID=UPI0039E5B098
MQKTEYGHGHIDKLIHSAGAPGDPDAIRFNRRWHEQARDGELQNIDFRVRDYAIGDKQRIAMEESLRRVANEYRRWSGKEIEREAVPWAQQFFLCAFPSHHQKTVLIDYEHPELAVGFVMGHNMHNNYWDTSDHHYDDAAGEPIRNFVFEA